MDSERRDELSGKEINELPDSAFAYIEPGGKKDAEGKTVPRSLRHFPIHDAAHVRNALARAPQSPFGEKAMPKILAAAKKFGVEVSEHKFEKLPTEGESQGGAVRRRPRHRAVPLMPEVRFWRADGLEVRSSTTSDEIIITGSPIVYDTSYKVTDIFGEFEEEMRAGVAAPVLQRGADVRFLFNHDGLPLARTLAGTLSLADGPSELRMQASLSARQQLANDLAIAIERGDVTQMSAGFIVSRDTWDDREEHRAVEEFADLLDVSAVTYPASPTTQLSVAQRMVSQIPVESRARVRRLYAELRAGKVLSQEHQDKLVNAAKAIHMVLDHAGFDPQNLVGQEEDEGREGGTEYEPLQGGESGRGTTEDGTIGGNVAGDNSPGYADGTGARSIQRDPGEPIVSHLSALSLQIEARRRRRLAG